MRDERKDLAVHAKRTDAEITTTDDGVCECDRVCTTDVAQVVESLGWGEAPDITMRCLTKVDAVIGKLTTKAPANSQACSLRATRER